MRLRVGIECVCGIKRNFGHFTGVGGGSSGRRKMKELSKNKKLVKSF